MAQALARLLTDCGQSVVAMAGRDARRTAQAAAFAGPAVEPVTLERLPALAARILIAVPDDAIAPVAEVLASVGARHGVALHTSGSRGPAEMRALAAAGVACGVLHPLQTVATPEQGTRALRGCAYAIVADGPDSAASEWAREIVALLDGEALSVEPGSQPLYHAAAVMASNYVAALTDAAVILMGEAGIPAPQALQALGPLLSASAANVLALTPKGALTGPLERRDVRTLAAHLSALDRVPPAVRELYRSAARQTLELARRKHPTADYSAVETLFSEGAES
jgi:predicted short-subunit dehydrogenase-like oxidoreductase (DUF2520 family)